MQAWPVAAVQATSWTVCLRYIQAAYSFDSSSMVSEQPNPSAA